MEIEFLSRGGADLVGEVGEIAWGLEFDFAVFHCGGGWVSYCWVLGVCSVRAVRVGFFFPFRCRDCGFLVLDGWFAQVAERRICEVLRCGGVCVSCGAMTVVVSWVRFVLAVCLRTRNVDRARRLIALSARLIGAEAVGSLHHLEACAEQQNSLAPLDTWPDVR